MAKKEAQAPAEGVSEAEEISPKRGIPSLNAGGKGSMPAAVKLVVGCAVILAILGVVATVAFQKAKQSRDERATEKAEATKATSESKLRQLSESDFEKPPLPPAVGGELNDQQAPQATAEASGATGVQYASAAGQPADGTATSSGQYAVPAMSPQEQYAEALKARRLAPALGASMAPTDGQDRPAAGAVSALPGQLPTDGSDLDAAMAEALRASARGIGQGGAAGDQQQSARNSLEDSLRAVNPTLSIAAQLSDPSMTISQGTILPCSLDTAINSQLPGMVKCTLSLPVYSTDSRVVLLDRGTTLIGQYQGGQMKQGMSRIFVLWTRAETPQHVIVQLDSPGTDGLGRSGIGGKVNNHFWQRFGAGMVLSVVNDSLTYATQQRSNRGGDTQNFQFGSTSETAKDAAAIAVENSVNIPPTQSTAQGSTINVFIARDLYFGGVYGLRLANQ